jgi:hypothetical protein
VDLTQTDIDGITAAVRDYYEGWYGADPERMRRALHPRLAKRHVERGPNGDWTIDDLSADMMIDETAGRTAHDPLPPYAVEVVDGHGRAAVVRGSSADFIDYLHLGKFGDRWLILNAMWENLG